MIVDVIYYSLYCTKGQQIFHSNNYTQSIAQTFQTSFIEGGSSLKSMPTRTSSSSSSSINNSLKSSSETSIKEEEEEIHDSNSTGIISSIRKQKQALEAKEAKEVLDKQEVIEITDTMSSDEFDGFDEEELSNTNSLQSLDEILKDDYNAVLVFYSYLSTVTSCS